MLGRARQVKVPKENTIIVDGMGDTAQIAAVWRRSVPQMEETPLRLRP